MSSVAVRSCSASSAREPSSNRAAAGGGGVSSRDLVAEEAHGQPSSSCGWHAAAAHSSVAVASGPSRFEPAFGAGPLVELSMHEWCDSQGRKSSARLATAATQPLRRREGCTGVKLGRSCCVENSASRLGRYGASSLTGAGMVGILPFPRPDESNSMRLTARDSSTPRPDFQPQSAKRSAFW